MGTTEQSQKITESKGTCKLGKQENMVKFLCGTREQRKKFQGNTGTPPGRDTPTYSLYLNPRLNLLYLGYV